jgi:hypothetical protein
MIIGRTGQGNAGRNSKYETAKPRINDEIRMTNDETKTRVSGLLDGRAIVSSLEFRHSSLIRRLLTAGVRGFVLRISVLLRANLHRKPDAADSSCIPRNAV